MDRFQVQEVEAASHNQAVHYNYLMVAVPNLGAAVHYYTRKFLVVAAAQNCTRKFLVGAAAHNCQRCSVQAEFFASLFHTSGVDEGFDHNLHPFLYFKNLIFNIFAFIIVL